MQFSCEVKVDYCKLSLINEDNGQQKQDSSGISGKNSERNQDEVESNQMMGVYGQ